MQVPLVAVLQALNKAKEAMMSTIPMNRMGRPEEIGATAVFLLSEGASYITRQVITVDGGMVG